MKSVHVTETLAPFLNKWRPTALVSRWKTAVDQRMWRLVLVIVSVLGVSYVETMGFRNRIVTEMTWKTLGTQTVTRTSPVCASYYRVYGNCNEKRPNDFDVTPWPVAR